MDTHDDTKKLALGNREAFEKLREYNWIGNHYKNEYCEIRLQKPAKFLIRVSGKTCTLSTNNYNVYKMRHWSITAFGKWRVDKDKYFVDNNGYVMRALQECLQFDAILKYDWHALIPQPIAEEMFPATTRHLRKFRRTITLWEFRKDAIKRRHARGIVPIYVLRKQPIG